MENLYDAVGGDATFTRLVRGFYAQVPGDDILGPMYPQDDMEGAEQRLKWFLAQYWGGPTEFSDHRGHPRLRMRHARFPIDPAAAERWKKLMRHSLDQIDEDTISPEHRAAIWEHMERVADMLINRWDMPDEVTGE